MASEEQNNPGGPSSAAGTSKPVEQPQNPPAEPDKNSTEEAFLKALEKVPLFGPWLVVVFKKWHWQGLILVLVGMLAGSILMTCMFVFSLMPDWSVPDKYKKSISVEAGAKENAQRTIPRGKLEITEVLDESEEENWIKEYRHYFRRTAAAWSNHPTRSASTRILKLKKPLENTLEFTWLLDLRADYKLESARAFRVTKSGLIQPLNNSDSVPTHFRVPPCDKGDSLIALVMITQPRDSADEITVPLFQSYVP